jgi:hypothetical protein
MKKQILTIRLSVLFPNTVNLDYSVTEAHHVPQPNPEKLRLYMWHVTILSYKSCLQISQETFYCI